MNIWSSRRLCKEELLELQTRTVFSDEEIEVLFDRFKYLDRGNGDFLTFLDFQLIPEFYSSPFCALLINYLESLNSFEKVSFASYLEFMSIFSQKTPLAKRIAFLFNIFDFDKVKKIDKINLEKIYFMINQKENPEEVDLVLKMFDKENKGYLSIEDFGNFYNSNPQLEKNMVVDFGKFIRKKETSGYWNKKVPENKKIEKLNM